MNNNIKRLLFVALTRNKMRQIKLLYSKYRIKNINKQEKMFINIIKNYIENDTIVLDIGANIGQWSYNLLNHISDNGLIFAFEPFPESFKVLVTNINDKRIRFFNVALSDKKTTANIIYNPFSIFPPEAAILDTADQIARHEQYSQEKIFTDKLDN